MSRSEAIASVIRFKVFIKGDDGLWRVLSAHGSRREAEAIADIVTAREGLIARVML